MKKALLFFCLIINFTSCESQGAYCVMMPAPSRNTIETVVDDSGGSLAYNGFPWPQSLSDGSILTGWKRSATHPDAGPFMLALSINGGNQWTKRQLTVGGVPITCSALTLKKIGSYIIVSYQDDVVYTTVKFARILETDLLNNFTNADFSSCGAVNFLSNYSSSPFSQPVALPSGKIYQPYYSIGIGPNAGKCISGLVQSTDGGSSWSLGPTIYTETSPNPSPGEIVSETAVCVIETGVTDATTKLVAYLRNETHDFYTHAHSNDGGQTWIVDNINFFHSFPIQVAKSPLAVILKNGIVYIIDGVRNVSGVYTLQYLTANGTDVLSNNQAGYSAPVVISYTANSSTNGAAIDWGYAEPFIDLNNQLWVHFYDTSPTQDGGDRNCMIYQIKIAN